MKIIGIRGFTLIELMVTLAVLAIIAMMAIPSFNKMIANNRLDSTARSMALLFGETRSQAIALRKNITIKFECLSSTCANTPTTYYWVSPHKDIELKSDKVDVIFTVVGLAQQRVKLVDNPVCSATPSPNACDTDASNNPRKIPQIVPLSFTLCNSDLAESRTITVSKMGVVNGIVRGKC